MQNKEKISKNVNPKNVIKLKKEQIKKHKINSKKESAITLIALVITIVLNSSYLAMARMNRFEKI